MHNFKEFKVWQKAIDLAANIYRITSLFPGDEKYGMVSQIRRSAVSISSNIAEGCGRKTDKDFSNFLSFSLGSQFELETHLIISRELNFLSKEDYESMVLDLSEIQKMTRTLIGKFSKS